MARRKWNRDRFQEVALLGSYIKKKRSPLSEYISKPSLDLWEESTMLSNRAFKRMRLKLAPSAEKISTPSDTSSIFTKDKISNPLLKPVIWDWISKESVFQLSNKARPRFSSDEITFLNSCSFFGLESAIYFARMGKYEYHRPLRMILDAAESSLS